MAADARNKGQRYQRIGKYQIVKHINNGGMGAVYKAIDTELQRQVALKILHPELASKPNMLERFRREARAAARLRHENIVAIYDVGQDGDMHFLAMEFVEGIDLHEYITRKGMLKPEETRQILIQATRALDHAHQQGIVHRDIKPSNFLLAKGQDCFILKLTDMGLARPVQDDEFRVTAPSTTVGTVDYMSPEQARDSRAADSRSDIYSLGCTLFHMLAGMAPFPEGSLPERLNKHAEDDPPDIRTLNKSVPDGLVVILGKMLAKKPSDRYQTPAELLDDLENYKKLRLTRDRAESLASLAALAGDVTHPAPSKGKLRRRTDMDEEHEPGFPDHPPEEADDPKTEADRPARQETTTSKPKPRPVPRMPPRPKKLDEESLRSDKPAGVNHTGILLAVGMVVLAGLLIYIGLKLTSREPAPAKKDPSIDPGLVKKDPEPQAKSKDKDVEPKVDPRPLDKQKQGKYPRLFDPAKAPDPAALVKEFYGSFGAFPQPAPGATLFRVSRVASAGPGSFASLAEAIASAGPGQTVIEILDQGPLIMPSLPPIQDRNIVIRGGDGFRPLLAWDAKPLKENGDAGERMLSLTSSQLQLVNVDVVARCQELPGQVSFFHLQGSDLQAQRCTFSVAGKQSGGVALARLEPYAARQPRCRLSQCYARGGNLTALDLQRGGEALLDGTLIVGAQAPLMRGGDAPAMIRVVRSTLVAGDALLEIPAPLGGGSVKLLAWDALFAAVGPSPTTAMLRLGASGNSERLGWRVYNCLYAGWRNLLDVEGRVIVPAALKAFQERWKYTEGDRVQDATWPPRLGITAIDEIEAGAYATHGTQLAFAATSNDVPLGCETAAVPAGPHAWLKRTFASPEASTIPLPVSFPQAGAERLDLNKIDLGRFLESRLKDGRPPPRIVLHLTGQGERLTSPIRVKGVKELVMYFEPARTKPLSLAPQPQATAGVEALIDVEDGNLEIINARLRLENSRFAPGPQRLIRVKNGSLRLGKSSLIGPMRKGPREYVGLIDLQSTTPDALAINESVLISDKKLIMISGNRSAMRIKHSLLVSGEDGIQVKAPSTPTALNHLWLWEESTFAFAGDLIDVSDLLPANAAASPSLSIHSMSNLFLTPFQDPSRATSLLRCRGDWLIHGSMLWRGKNNAFDQKRLSAYVNLADREATLATHLQWVNLWGAIGEQQSLLFDAPAGGAKLLGVDDPPSLLRLVLPKGAQPPPGQPRPGADTARLPQ
ncbi:MAG: hypothetical protein FJ271_10830 [Planctomycetes bacterium]|nr:hypothetical protein [Planctomycetota bacterium]